MASQPAWAVIELSGVRQDAEVLVESAQEACFEIKYMVYSGKYRILEILRQAYNSNSATELYRGNKSSIFSDVCNLNTQLCLLVSKIAINAVDREWLRNYFIKEWLRNYSIANYLDQQQILQVQQNAAPIIRLLNIAQAAAYRNKFDEIASKYTHDADKDALIDILSQKEFVQNNIMPLFNSFQDKIFL